MSAVIINYITPITASPEKILDTIVYINGASGVIVYSNDKYTLILTDYHVIVDLVDKYGNFITDTKPHVLFSFVYENNNVFETTNIYYECKEVYVDKLVDLAILRIDVGTKLNYSKLVIRNIRVAEEVYIVANPNYNYRTIVKGIISSKSRYINNSPLWQISGGVIYGSSGGGAFTMGGELIALARSVDLWFTGFCNIMMIDNIEISSCLDNPITYIGYFTPPRVIKNFLLSTKFKDKFNYLK